MPPTPQQTIRTSVKRRGVGTPRGTPQGGAGPPESQDGGTEGGQPEAISQPVDLRGVGGSKGPRREPHEHLIPPANLPMKNAFQICLRKFL